MRPFRILFSVACLMILVGCSPAGSKDDSETPLDVLEQAFFDPDHVETELGDFLRQDFGLATAEVTYEDGVVTLWLEQPEAISDEQVTLLYLGALDAAARFAPASRSIMLTITVGGDPFIALRSDTEQINAYRRGEIDLTAFVGGLEISLPDTGSAPTTTGLTKATVEPTSALTAELSIGTVSITYHEYYGWRVYATLVNRGNAMVGGANALVEVFDAGGERIASERVWAMQSVIAPMSFSVLALELPGGTEPATAQVSDPEASDIYTPTGIELSIGEVRQLGNFEVGQVTLVTELTNQTDVPVVVESVLGLLMSEQGEVLAHVFDWNYAPQLLPGETTPLAMTWNGIPAGMMNAVGRVELLPEARPADTIRESSLSFSASTRLYLDANGWPHLIGVLRNEGRQPERPVLMGALLDANGRPIDAFSDWGLPPVVMPGMAISFDLFNWPMLSINPELVLEVASYELFVDVHNSYAPQEYEIVPIDDFVVEWKMVEDEVELQGSAAINRGAYDDVIAIMLLRDKSSGMLLGAVRSYLYGEGDEALLYERLLPDPTSDLSQAELLVDIYAVKLLE